VSGEENHVLTLPEIPSHNHTKSGSTTNGSDGITDVSGNHNHTGSTGSTTLTESPANVVTSLNVGVENKGVGTLGSADVVTGVSANTTPSTVSPNPHDHTIGNDGAHQHYIASNGGNQKHNNMQPTIFVGNMFIYTGKPTYGKYPLPMPQTSPYPIL
jgi:microcystin-dependent protein